MKTCYYSDSMTRVKQILKSHPKGLTITEISRLLGTNRNSVAKYLDVMLISGQIEVRIIGVAKAFTLASRVPIMDILDHISDNIIILNEDLNFIHANKKGLALLGQQEADIVGTRMSNFHTPFVKAIYHNLTECLAGEHIEDIMTCEHEGRETKFQVKFVPIAFDNGTSGIMIVIKDM